MPELEQKVNKSMSDESSENIQRPTIKRKAALVFSIMKGKTSVA